MKELEEAITKTFGDMVASGKLTEIIEGHVQKSVDSVFRSFFETYSPFQEALQEYINQNLRVNFEGLGLAAAVFKFAEKQITQGLEYIFEGAPAEIKLSALVAMLEESERQDDSQSEGISCHVELDKYTEGYHWIKLDRKRRKSSDECEYSIAVNKQGEGYNIGLPHRGDVTKKLFAGPFYGFDRALFQLYAAKSKLIIDEDAI